MAKIRVVVSEADDDLNNTEFNLLSYQRAVQEWIDSVPEEFRANAVIIYSGGGDYFLSREIAYYRPKTEAELADEERNRAKSEEWRRRQELAEYERLKAKYGQT